MNDDPLVQRLEQWERRAIAAFLMVVKVIGLSALLIVEVFMVLQMWQFQMLHVKAAERGPTPCCDQCKASWK